MVQKKTTESGSTSNSSNFEEAFESKGDKWRSNERRSEDPSRGAAGHTLMESEMPLLDDNDIWYYQLQLESFIRRNAPGMDGRFMGMLAAVCAQARRANKQDGGS